MAGALGGTALGEEIQHQHEDIMATTKELQAELERVQPGELTTTVVTCLCHQGACHEGEAECAAACQGGYSGLYCDKAPDSVINAVVHN